MNPLLLLLGLLSMGALTQSGGHEDDASDDVSVGLSKRPTPSDRPKTGRPAPTEPEVVTEPEIVTEPEAPVQSGESSSGGSGTAVVAEGRVEVLAGRVTTLQPGGDDIVSVRIVDAASAGSTTVNPDNSIALVLTRSDATGSDRVTYEVTHADGSTSQHQVDLDMVAGPQEQGWATGEHVYMLATDADGRVIVEEGDLCTKVYVSGSADALSLADIAAREGVELSQVTGKFLLQSDYGQSEGLALDGDAAAVLWKALNTEHPVNSNWLLFESGYTYASGVTSVGTSDDPLHPNYVGAWGDGARPQLDYKLWVKGGENVVFQGLNFTAGTGAYQAQNVIFDDCEVQADAISAIGTTGFTFRDGYVHDSYSYDTAYTQGLYVGMGSKGILVEGSFFDHNGWTDDWSDQPDNMSHNVYINYYTDDVTLRDTISSRAAANGFQIRSGGFFEDNALFDNNSGIVQIGGHKDTMDSISSYSLWADNIVTDAGWRIGERTGSYSWGIREYGDLTTLIDNIVAHSYDPNDPAAAPDVSEQPAYYVDDAFYDDTILWNWRGDHLLADYTGKGTEGLDPAAMNATTIQNFAKAVLGPDATLDDLYALLDAQAKGLIDEVITAEDIVNWFQQGFGVSDGGARTEAETLRFVPDDLGEGVRWDNRMNWTTEDLPGTVAGDSVDLAGNDVIFATHTATVDRIDTGAGGDLDVTSGKLTATGGITGGAGATLDVWGSGQIWVDGASDLSMTVSGGRLANQGYVTDTDLEVHGGQVILGSDDDQWEVSDGHALEIFGAAAKVVFDGDAGGMALLDLDEGSTLRFAADAGGLGQIEEARSGAMGDAPDVLSGIDLEGATLEIDLAGFSAEAGSVFTLMRADEIAGVLSDAGVMGLGARDATIVVDYRTDTVRLELTAGTGLTSVKSIGSATDDTEAAHDALWAALTADHGLADDSVPVFEEEDLMAVA